MKPLHNKIITGLFIFFYAATAMADVKLPPLFTDHIVLQRNVPVDISLLVLNKLYNIPVLCSGPEVDQVEYVQDKVIIYFKTSSSALLAKNKYGYVLGFEIAGSDQQFNYATASIEGNKITLHSKNVSKPVAVRYNWSSNPEGNLFNEAGLAAAPFRTYDWKLSTVGKNSMPGL